MTEMDFVGLASKSALFNGFGPEALNVLLGYFTVMEGSRGDRLFEQGDDSVGLYVVAKGSVTGKVRDREGHERVVQQFKAPESFGELSLLLRGQRLVTVEADADVCLLELTYESFRRLKSRNPDLCLMLIMAIVRRFGRVLDDSRDLLQRLLLRQLSGIDAP